MAINRIETLGAWWEELNEKEFGGRLPEPRFGLTRSRNTDGFFEHYPGTKKMGKIVLAQRTFEDDDLFLGTLLHEMIHQYQHEVLERAANHDAIFTSIARRLERKYKVRVR